MAQRGRSPSSTRTGAENKRSPGGSRRAPPSSVPSFLGAPGSASPPSEEVAALQGRPGSPAPAYKLHDLTKRFVAVRGAEHGARVFAPAEEDELLRRGRGGEAAQHIRCRAQRVAIGAHEQLAAADLLRELVGDRRDGGGDGGDQFDV